MFLVNNAGYAMRCSVSDPDILEKYQQNNGHKSAFIIYLTHLSVKHLEKTKGNIVNISSLAGLKPVCNSILELSCYNEIQMHQVII